MITTPRRTRSRSIGLAAALGGLGCLAVVVAGLAVAASGDLDRSFSGDGIAKTGFGAGGRGFGYAQAVAVQPNDRILIAGDTKSGHFGLARFRRGGKLDRSFGSGGTVRIDFGPTESPRWYPRGLRGAWDVAVQDDGRIVVVGRARVEDRTQIGIARLRPSGDLDPSFGTGGKMFLDPFEPPVEAVPPSFTLALEPGGDILVGGAGSSLTAPGPSPGFVVRLHPDGGLDPSFADGGVKTIDLAPGTMDTTYVNQVIIDARSRIAAALTTWPDPSASDEQSAVMLRLRSNGDYDPSFSGDGWRRIPHPDSELLSIAAAPHGRLVGAGRAGQEMLVTRVQGSGAFDRSFAGDGIKTTVLPCRARFDRCQAMHAAVARRVMLQRNGRSLIAAHWHYFETDGDVVVRLRPNGVLDHSFSRDGKRVFRYHIVRAATRDTVMQANGKILLAGVASGRRPASTPKAYVARLKNHGQPFVTP